jgi:hypothetical protein
MEMGGKRSAEDRLMARSRFIYTLKEVALRISENIELIEGAIANSDNPALGGTDQSGMVLYSAWQTDPERLHRKLPV